MYVALPPPRTRCGEEPVEGCVGLSYFDRVYPELVEGLSMTPTYHFVLIFGCIGFN